MTRPGKVLAASAQARYRQNEVHEPFFLCSIQVDSFLLLIQWLFFEIIRAKMVWGIERHHNYE